jgi:D-glycero-alpha-D-manno-heptose-7-phosphate kinase
LTNLSATQELGYKIQNALQKGNGHRFGELMHQHWLTKRKRAATTNEQIDDWYELARKAGAIGGKIMGAGGGGFFLFYFEGDAPKFIQRLSQAGLRHVPFRFDFNGSKVMIDA